MKKLFLLAILITGIGCSVSAKTPLNVVDDYSATPLDGKKIIVVSDPHVMAPDLLVSEGEAWTTYLRKQRKLVDYSKQLLDEMIRRIKEELRPGLVLITGDLTKDGEQVSHQYVISKLDELSSIGVKTLVIPGNHDRGTNSDAVSYDGSNTTPVDVATDGWFATQYANYGYGTTSEREGTTLTYACEPITGLVVIGIDSGTDGNVSETTLNWVVEKATAARASGKKVIAMMHHPLIPHFSGVDKFVNTAVVVNYAIVRNTLADAGIRVVFTGHFHTSDIAKDWNADKSREIYDVNTGSLISYPCDYRVVTLDDDLSELSITTKHISELASVDGFAEKAKTRLKSAMKTKVEENGNAYLPIAPTAADAFIIHAEGNETENASAENILSSLTFAATLGVSSNMIDKVQAQKLKDMAYSMLQDKSQYGTERENVTNDLTLSIELPEAIKLAADGYSTYCSGNILDITKTAGLTAYIVSNVTENTVVLQTVNVIPSTTGFIVNGNGGALYDLFKSDATATADDVSGNKLLGTLTATVAPANTFALSTKNNVTGFYPVGTVGTVLTIPAHKAYLTLAEGEARTISFGGETTGISLSPDSSPKNGEVFYNLEGQRVMTPTKGMYIVNGKKVIIK